MQDKISNEAEIILRSAKEKGGIGKEEIDTFLGKSTEDAFQELMDLRAIELNEEGKYVVTKNGDKAFDKGIIPVYPLTPNNSAKGYNKTLLTQTSSAKNAFLNAFTTVGTAWFQDEGLTKRSLSAFFEMLLSVDIFKRLHPSVVLNALSLAQNSQDYYLNRNPDSKAVVQERYTIYQGAYDKLDYALNEFICNLEDFKLPQPFEIDFGENYKLFLIAVKDGKGVFKKDIEDDDENSKILELKDEHSLKIEEMANVFRQYSALNIS